MVASRILPVATAALFLTLLFGPTAFSRTQGFLIATASLLFPALVFAGAVSRVASAWTPICAFLGEVSYPFYLFHVVAFHFLLLGPLQALIQRHPVLLFCRAEPATILLLIPFSYLLAKYVDAPFRKLLTRRVNAIWPPQHVLVVSRA